MCVCVCVRERERERERVSEVPHRVRNLPLSITVATIRTSIIVQYILQISVLYYVQCVYHGTYILSIIARKKKR